MAVWQEVFAVSCVHHLLEKAPIEDRVQWMISLSFALIFCVIT